MTTPLPLPDDGLKRFEIHGHFQAEGIDDAFRRLALHFTALAAGDDEPPDDHLGLCEIRIEKT